MNLVFLSGTHLFRGAEPEEITAMLGCLHAEERRLAKDVCIYRLGDRIQSIGLVLRGAVSIERVDIWGNRTILDSVRPGQLFAETYACAGEPLMVDVITTEESDVLFINVERLLRMCPSACTHHSRLIRNLLSIAALKNLHLTRRSFYTATRSLRGRLLAYLSDQAEQAGSRSFTIPFDRQQLADYLNVDRSALSGEIGKLRREGILAAERNRFALLLEIDEKHGQG